MKNLVLALVAAPSCLAAVLKGRGLPPNPVVQDCAAHGDRAYSGAHCVRDNHSLTAFQVDCLKSPTIKYNCADGWVCLDALDLDGKNMAVCTPQTLSVPEQNNSQNATVGSNAWIQPVNVSSTRQVAIGTPITALAEVVTSFDYPDRVHASIDVYFKDNKGTEINNTRKHCDNCTSLGLTNFPSGWANFGYTINYSYNDTPRPPHSTTRSFLLTPLQLGLPDSGVVPGFVDKPTPL